MQDIENVTATPVVASAPVTAELAATGPAPASLLKGFDAPVENDVKVAAVAAPAMPAPVAVKPEPKPVAAPLVVTPAVKPAPLIKAPSGPAKAAVKAEPKSKPEAKPVKLALAKVEPKQPAPRQSVSGSHLVQLGAFSSSASAKRAWEKLTNRHSVLTGFSSASSTVKVNGKTLIRLAAMGFGNKESAKAVCDSIKASGGSCIVRSAGGGKAPVRMASAGGQKVAVR